MQDNNVCAFRQRLLRFGFRKVSIKCFDLYLYVTCLSPAGEFIERCYLYSDIVSLPHRVTSYVFPLVNIEC